MALESFWKMVLFTIPYDVELLVCRGVASCRLTISSNIFLFLTPSFASRYRAAI